jgi:hypothetical protein
MLTHGISDVDSLPHAEHLHGMMAHGDSFPTLLPS